jgi:hypothetical protein
MKKKIKNLTLDEMVAICKKNIFKCCAGEPDACPLLIKFGVCCALMLKQNGEKDLEVRKTRILNAGIEYK